MARTSIATDAFPYSNGALTTNWTQLNDNWGTVNATSNKVYGSISHSVERAAARWTGTGTFTADQYASIVTSAGGFNSDNDAIGVICRASADVNAGRDFYYALFRFDQPGAAASAVLGKYVNGTHTILNAASTAWTTGDRMELECESTTIRVMKNGVALGGSWTQTDSSISTGAPGIIASGANTSFSLGDDWEGGNLTAGSTPLTFTGSDSLAGGELI